MFVTGFESLHDNLTWYYIVALVVTLLAITIAFLFSLRNMDENQENENESVDKEETPTNEEDQSGLEEDVNQGIKKSPAAVIAERVIKANMTEEQKNLEQEVRKKQLAEIFKLMQQETDKFGDVSLTEVEEQMKLYQ